MLNIARANIYHDIMFDIKSLCNTIFSINSDDKVIQEFENEFAKYMTSKYCITFPLARTAIYYILKSQNFPENSEIIMPPITIKPMMDVVLSLKLKPIFIDLSLDNMCFDIDKLKECITPNTKAVLMTYLFGIVPEVDKLMKLFKDNNVFVIEDFSHNLNAQFNNKKLGTFGNVGVYSSSSLKTLDTYGGGLVITDDDELNIKLREVQRKLGETPKTILRKTIMIDLIRNISMNKLIFTIIIRPLLKVIKKLNYTLYLKIVGKRLNLTKLDILPKEWFYSYSSFQAKIGLELLNKVEKEDKKRVENVNVILNKVNRDFLSKSYFNNDISNVYWQFAIKIDNVDKFEKFLDSKKIDVAVTNLSLISDLDIYPDYKTNLKNAKIIKDNYVFIPCYPALTINDMKYIATNINNYVEDNDG